MANDDEGHSINDDLRMMGLPKDDEEDLVADQEALFGRSAAMPINLATNDGDGDGASAACDIQVVRQLDTKFGYIICKQDIVYTRCTKQ
jgi:hypothetical protein